MSPELLSVVSPLTCHELNKKHMHACMGRVEGEPAAVSTVPTSFLTYFNAYVPLLGVYCIYEKREFSRPEPRPICLVVGRANPDLLL